MTLEPPLPFELPPVVPCQTIYFVGDSNTLLFNYLTFDAPEYFPQPIVTRSCYVPALSAQTICEGGELAPDIIAFFRREIALENAGGWRRYFKTRRGQPEMTQFRRVMAVAAQDEHNHDNSLAVVIVIGAIDLGYLLRELGTAADFTLADPYYVRAAFDDPELPAVASRAVFDLIRRRLAPLAAAIARFRDLGFPNVYVHSLHPPTLDDVRYFRIRHTMSSAKIRYKTTIALNRELERLATANGGRFLDMWPATTVGGKVDPALELDGDHLNRAAAALTLDALARDIIARRGAPLDERRRTPL